MHDDLAQVDEALRREADELLKDRGLEALLSAHGLVRPTGSYVLRLMAWRDLDLYLVSENLVWCPVNPFTYA